MRLTRHPPPSIFQSHSDSQRQLYTIPSLLIYDTQSKTDPSPSHFSRDIPTDDILSHILPTQMFTSSPFLVQPTNDRNPVTSFRRQCIERGSVPCIYMCKRHTFS